MKDILGETLNSLAQQTYPDKQFEVIVVDDGSADSTPDVLATFETRLELRFARQQNAGAKAAQGEILVFLHADCRLQPGCLEAMTAAAE